MDRTETYTRLYLSIEAWKFLGHYAKTKLYLNAKYKKKTKKETKLFRAICYTGRLQNITKREV